MNIYVVWVLATMFLLFIPYWLPYLVIRLRMMIFATINGKNTVQLPNYQWGEEAFRIAYSHAAVNGRSDGATLSDLFWYWLAPGPEMHQEHIENGPRYEKIAGFTRRLLAVSRSDIEDLVDRFATDSIHLSARQTWQFVRLRDLMMTFWADFYYQLVFQENPTVITRKLIVDNADDVVTALKCCSLRHMQKRERLTIFLLSKLSAGEFPHQFPEGFSIEEQAFYLQGTFFNTAVVQMSEAMAHLLMTLAQHGKIQENMRERSGGRSFFDDVIYETLRLYPLFGIAHRITKDDIQVGEKILERGSVVCFNYPQYQQLGFEQAQKFQPERWRNCSLKEANFIPFGMTENRPCPAQGIALISMRRLTQNLLQYYRFSSSVKHTRSMPNRGPCMVILRNRDALPLWLERLLKLLMKIRDQWEEVYCSFAQLILGTIMIIDARRLGLCQNYFASLHAGEAQKDEKMSEEF